MSGAEVMENLMMHWCRETQLCSAYASVVKGQGSLCFLEEGLTDCQKIVGQPAVIVVFAAVLLYLGGDDYTRQK